MTAGGEHAGVFENRAAHVGDAFEQTIALCRDAVRLDGPLDHVAHYTVGVYDFSLDVLSKALAGAAASRQAEHGLLDRRREDYRRIGRQVTFAASNLDGALEDVRAGTVIRLILHASAGMLICCPVIPKEYIVALVANSLARPTAGVPLTDLPGAAAADDATADLVNACRTHLGLRTQDPGGWRTAASKGETPAGALARDLSDEPKPSPDAGPDQQSVVELCRAALNPDHLHYVAHCRGPDVVFAADQLSDRQISRYFTQISPEARRKFYRDFCRGLSLLAGQLGRVVAPAIGAPVERIVVDLQQGAIYYYRLRTGEYLVGVTLEQRGVDAADRAMARLALHCAALLSAE